MWFPEKPVPSEHLEDHSQLEESKRVGKEGCLENEQGKPLHAKEKCGVSEDPR